MQHILKCDKCKKYLISLKCSCGAKSISVKPPKYSTEDNYAKYRREAKKESLQKEGFL